MKKEIVVGVLIAAVITALVAVVALKTLTERREVKFHLGCELPPGVEGELSSYRVVPYNLSTEEFLQMARVLGLNGTPSPHPDYPGYILVVEQEGYMRSLEYFSETGVFAYSDERVSYPTSPPPQESIPMVEEAREIAEEFMRRWGFWQDNMTPASTGSTTMGVGGKGGEGGQEWVLSRSVSFTEHLEGYPLGGAGAKVSVTVGADGEIGGFILPRRSYIATGVVNTISPEEAYRKLKIGEQMDGLILAEGDVYIKEVYPAYYLSTILEDPREILPCYVFEGVLEDGEEVQFYVSAVE